MRVNSITMFLAAILLSVLSACHKDTLDVDSDLSISSGFSIPMSQVQLNPTGYAPLSALLTYTSHTSGYTRIIVKGKHGSTSDISQVFTDNGTVHSIPIAGLYANYSNTVEVYLVGSDHTAEKSILTIKTGSLPVNLPTYIKTDTVNLSQMEPGQNLVSSFAGYPAVPQIPYIIDSYGDIRWCLDYSTHPQLKNLYYDCGLSRLQNGNFYFGDSNSGGIYEVDLLGKVVNTWSLGRYTFNHNVTEKPNGNFLITVSDPQSTHLNGVATIDDHVLEMDRTSGSILNVWDLRQSMDENRTTLSADPSDWFHTNAVIYDRSDNTIIVSGRVQGVVKLTSDNHVKWILSAHRGWGVNRRGEDLNQFLLTPLDASGTAITDTSVVSGASNNPGFEWNFYQHSPFIMPSGDLMLFDNGSTRNYNSSLPNYSRAVEFKIDTANKTVMQIWEYGKERGTSTFSTIVSSVQYLPQTKHILFSPGYQVPNASGAGGKIIEIDYASKKLIFQQSINTSTGFAWHRAKRQNIYANGNPYK